MTDGTSPVTGASGREIHCFRCERSLPAGYHFCPFCGMALADSNGRPLTEHEARFGELIDSQREEERTVVHLWRESLGRMLLVGMLLLLVPDSALLFVFHKWVVLDWTAICHFLLLDMVTGVIVVMLILSCGQRGTMGDLMLMALRFGQLHLIYAAQLMPFRDIMSGLLLFGALPALFVAVSALVLHCHLTDLLDRASREDS